MHYAKMAFKGEELIPTNWVIVNKSNQVLIWLEYPLTVKEVNDTVFEFHTKQYPYITDLQVAGTYSY